MKFPNLSHLSFLLLFLLRFLSPAIADHDSSGGTSIVYYTLGRNHYAFDIYSLPILDSPSPDDEIRITDGRNVNYNGHFPYPSSSSLLLSLFPNRTHIRIKSDPPPLQLVYVTERIDGFSNIFYDAVTGDNRIQVPLLAKSHKVCMKDKPTVTGDHLVYVSTHEDPGIPRVSWAAVYSTHLRSGSTRRLTPYGIADFSPAVSPSGIFTAVASYGEKGWDGEVEDLTTDIYIFLTRDGSQRVKVVEHGGWPAWVDDRTLYFHRRNDDDLWMSVYRATFPSQGPISIDSVKIERVTPPGLHVFTPATSPGNNKFIAVATKRPGSSYRHIELFDLVKKEFKELTRLVSPKSHHLNPFVSPDSTRVGYHRCRGEPKGNDTPQLVLENIRSTIPGLSLFRFNGMFPAFSPSGDRIVYTDDGIYVVNSDGSNPHKVSDIAAFSTAWDPVRPGIIYTSAGHTFASEKTEVDIVAVNVDDGDLNSYKRLTLNGINNAFPYPSPDGKWIVFRSGLSGYKNLYIMDAEEGERNGLQRLTEGQWDDTMCVWSPDGDWIIFASDRDNPGTGCFVLYMIHPNGTGLRKVIESGSCGKVNHPYFSPDGKSIVFTADYSGISAEPITNPHQFQPYGEIFIMKLDGSDLRRLTHDSYENGTPAWSPKYIKPVNVEEPKGGPYCGFYDCRWLNIRSDMSLLIRPDPTYMLLPKVQCAIM